MFGNFLYFILVLLIYSIYPTSEETSLSGLQTLMLFFGLIGVFILVTRFQFLRLALRISRDPAARLDHRFDALLTRQSVMAVGLFAVDVYGLNLPSLLSGIAVFSRIPTLQALLFLGLFVCYLSIVWVYAYDAQKQLYHTDMTRQAYVLSNISFSVPILIPWMVVSALADIVNGLPFEYVRRFAQTMEGQIGFFLLFLTVVAVFGPAMIQRCWRCRPLESGFYRDRIESVCRRADFSCSDILHWPLFGGQMITAGVMGLIQRFRYILVTDGLLRYLEPDELDAVIAHEIGHTKQHHLQFYLLFFVGYVLLAYATFDPAYAIGYAAPVHRFADVTGLDPTKVRLTLFGLVTIVIFLVYFRYIFGYFMRNFERQADTYVYRLFGSGVPLISTLKKIAAASGQSPDKPNWHHFSIQQRIEYLDNCERDRGWIARHNGRIRKSISAYIVGVVCIGGIGYSVNLGETGKNLRLRLHEGMLLREIEQAPGNPNLYGELGSVYYEKGDFGSTIRAWSESLALLPSNPQVLNNLAWLYATCKNREYRNPQRAVDLAEMAAGLLQEPHILDTLAESYYANGDMDRAIRAAGRALQLASENRNYYEGQLRKFLKAKKMRESDPDEWV